MASGTLIRLEAGIDWLSATLPAEHSLAAPTYSAAFDLMQHIADEGNRAKPAVRLGYKGVQCGKLFVGDSQQGLFILASGSAAILAYEHLYHTEMHISRIDLQVTQWNCPLGDDTGIKSELQAIKHKKTVGRKANRQIRHTGDDSGGYTLYIGSRTSESFMRLYNKDKESKDEYYRTAWRYEVELHNAAATAAAISLQSQKSTLEASITATVSAYCRERGLLVNWPIDQRLNVIRPIPKDEADDVRSIAWLTSQVRPTVQRLIRAGMQVDVLVALGIAED